jgi:phage-related protein
MPVVLVTYFTTASGAQPVRKYVDALDRPARAKVLAAILYIEAHGLDGGVVARQIKGKLWEIKIDAQRIFYVVMTGPEMVLLHAYQKQSQKAPRVEIETAERRFVELVGKKP